MLSLRDIKETDYPLTLAWRNNPLISKGFYQQRGILIDWDTHVKWNQSRSNWKTFIVETDHPIGVVTLGQLDHWSPEVGYYIDASEWGKGYGTEAVKLALEWLRNNGYKYCHTTVLKNNTRSINLLKRLGFKETKEAREGEIWLDVKLDQCQIKS